MFDDIVISDRYTVLEILGQGSMGQVLKCKDKKLGRTVAVKRILFDMDNEAIARFHHEAKVTSILEHPNILKVYDFGQADGGELFMVTDYIDGSSLRDWIDSIGAIGFKDVAPYLIQICQGLEYAHSKGIYHRDIKPTNIMLIDAGKNQKQVKLLDFGLAKVTYDLDPKITKTGMAVGSPAYMSPEQSMGRPIDARSDIYNFGCMMYQVLTGKTVFGSENPLEILKRQIQQKPPMLKDKIDKKFPEEVEALVSKCLEKKPENRFQSAKELEEAIKSALESYESRQSDDTYQEPKRKAKPLAKLILILVSSILTGSVIFVSYKFFEKQSSEEHQVVAKPFKYEDTMMSSTPVALGDAIDRSFGFKLKKNTEGEIFLDASGQVRDKDVKPALEKYKDLKIPTWEISHTYNFSGSGLKDLIGYPVKTLFLNKSSLNNDGLKNAAQIKSLEKLYIASCAMIDHRGISYLSELPKLKVLSLSHPNEITRQSMEEVVKIKPLQTLLLSKIKLTGPELEPLKKASNLEKVSVAQASITKNAMATIASIPTLKIVSLSNVTMSSEGMSILTKAKNIVELNLSHINLPKEDMRKIASMKQLKRLYFQNVKAPASQFESLRESLPECDITIE